MNPICLRVRRAANWSEAEAEALHAALLERRSLLESASNTMESNLQKKRCWQQIAGIVNSVGGNDRTADNCKKRWAVFKSQLKRKITDIHNKERTQTAGETSATLRLTSSEERAKHLLHEHLFKSLPPGSDNLLQIAGSSDISVAAVPASQAQPQKSEYFGSDAASDDADSHDECATPEADTASGDDATNQRKRSRLSVVYDRLAVERERMRLETERLKVERERLLVEVQMLHVGQELLQLLKERVLFS